MKRACRLQPCHRTAESGHDVCGTHRNRLKRGLPLHDESLVESKAAMDALWATLRPEMGPACINWPGSLNGGGYGRTSRNGQVIASRAAWIEVFGPIPPGMAVCHACDNRACVNPGHLFLGTIRDNVHDMLAKGRAADNNGIRNPQARLTAEQVDEIRLAVANGEKQASVGRRYGISKGHVNNIVNGKRRAVA